MRFGTYEASFDNLPRMLELIKVRNPGTQYDVKVIPSLTAGPSILQRTFFCIGACVRAFQYCFPLLCIDGTFLSGKYNWLLLEAYAFIESENIDSWYWFLERVKLHVVVEQPNVCLISDRHAGILEAINQLQHGGTRPPVCPDVRTRWCMRHLGANFHEHFKNKDFTDLFKSLCCQNRQRKFNAT